MIYCPTCSQLVNAIKHITHKKQQIIEERRCEKCNRTIEVHYFPKDKEEGYI